MWRGQGRVAMTSSAGDFPLDEGLDDDLDAAGPEEDGPDPAPPPCDPFAEVRGRAVASGGFCLDLPHHVIAHVPVPGADRLVVTFDNLAATRDPVRQIWGSRVLAQAGWSVMGVMIRRKDWFRHASLLDAFDMLRDSGFFRRHAHVSMYGASMGAYGALTFAPAAPGCTVVAFAPQTTLAPEIAPFEWRYRLGRALGDWTDPRYLDAAEGVHAAGRAYVFHDPFQPEDRLHAARLTGPTVTHLRLPHAGHKLPPALLRMGILKDVALQALRGELTEAGFARAWRARRRHAGWRDDLLARAESQGHARLVLAALTRLQADTPHWRQRHRLNALREKLAQNGALGPGITEVDAKPPNS